MRKLNKLKKLIVLISIAYTWSVLVGLWISETIKIKIKIKNHGRKQKSIFRCGFDFLTTFIKKLLTGNIYNDHEFNDVTKLLSCT